MATAAAAARARLLMVGTCLPTDKPLVLSAEDSVRMSSALLMLQRAHLTALLISPDGGYVFGTRELASDAPAIRALLHHAP
ncbi:hypothetical protein [Gemmatimonas sp.]|uniref:hypothetical protein n=1 Tax=Gemmatimonas sp. TaxID=1962908 RepID=UPI003DA5E25A